MSTDAIINFIFLAAAVAVSIPKRTRPLILAVAFVWLAMQAITRYDDGDSAGGLGCVIAALSIAANFVIYRKKYIKELKG